MECLADWELEALGLRSWWKSKWAVVSGNVEHTVLSLGLMSSTADSSHALAHVWVVVYEHV